MGWFKRKSDPLAERERNLNAQIAELEERIKQLSDQSTAPPAIRTPPPKQTPAAATTTTITIPPPRPEPPPARPKPAPSLAQPRIASATPPPPAATQPVPTELYNDLGVRKFDFTEIMRRITAWFKGPAPANPHLVKYLASGGLPGMRAMRYEKRVARNRFILLVVIFTVVLWFIIAAFLRGH